MLAADDRAIEKADRDAVKAQLTIDRIDALLPQLRSDLAAIRGRETLAELRAEHADMVRQCEPLNRWQTEFIPRFLPL